eukprot:3931681-Rhodomonas_salina.2
MPDVLGMSGSSFISSKPGHGNHVLHNAGRLPLHVGNHLWRQLPRRPEARPDDDTAAPRDGDADRVVARHRGVLEPEVARVDVQPGARLVPAHAWHQPRQRALVADSHPLAHVPGKNNEVHHQPVGVHLEPLGKREEGRKVSDPTELRLARPGVEADVPPQRVQAKTPPKALVDLPRGTALHQAPQVLRRQLPANVLDLRRAELLQRGLHRRPVGPALDAVHARDHRRKHNAPLLPRLALVLQQELQRAVPRRAHRKPGLTPDLDVQPDALAG